MSFLEDFQASKHIEQLSPVRFDFENYWSTAAYVCILVLLILFVLSSYMFIPNHNKSVDCSSGLDWKIKKIRVLLQAILWCSCSFDILVRAVR